MGRRHVPCCFPARIASSSNSASADRAADILATVKRCSAATIIDIADDLALHRETVRKRLAALVATGKLILIEAAATHSRALYGVPDLDDQAEFDLYRTRTNNWPRGQHGRDCLVVALFGAPVAMITTSPPCAHFAPQPAGAHS
ncbi:helix-turn-helix domain-containing protein [Janthinobacterium sp. FT14W]|nr:helix-turn-helix domain-containing protein [Janthinobacterium sp. FT14W]